MKLSSLQHWHHHHLSLLSYPPISFSLKTSQDHLKVQSQFQEQQQLTSRERRQLRNERRENSTKLWKEEVEDKLIKIGDKKKKEKVSLTEELNLDNLALLGTKWWALKVAKSQDTAERLQNKMIRNFPTVEFEVCVPATHVKRKLKDGRISVRSKLVIPGCVFVRCVMNKELHDFIKEVEGVGSFIGSTVGNSRRQIHRPKPFHDNEIEATFKKVKEEQKILDRAFEEQQKEAAICKDQVTNIAVDVADPKLKRKTKNALDTNLNASKESGAKKLTPGSSVRALSGTFMDFTGNLKKLNRKTKKATVVFMLFGKESLVEMDVDHIVADTT